MTTEEQLIQNFFKFLKEYGVFAEWLREFKKQNKGVLIRNFLNSPFRSERYWVFSAFDFDEVESNTNWYSIAYGWRQECFNYGS